MENLEEIRKDNFIRLAREGMDLSFLLDPEISDKEFLKKLGDFFFFLSKETGNKEILTTLPDIKSILDNPKPGKEDLKKINLKLYKIAIEMLGKQIKELYKALREIEGLLKNEKEKEIHSNLLEIIKGFIKAINYQERALEENSEKKAVEAFTVLQNSQKKLAEFLKEYWEEEDSPLYEKIESTVENYEKGDITGEDLREFIENSRELLEAVSSDYDSIEVEDDELTEEVLEGHDMFQKGLEHYFNTLKILEEAVNEQDEEKKKEKLERAVNLAYKADQFLNKLHQFSEEVNKSSDLPENSFQDSLEEMS